MNDERTIRSACRRRRLLAAVVAAALAAALAAGCAPVRHKVEPGKVIRVGFSIDSLVIERWKRDIDTFSRAVKELGGVLVLEQADQDPAVQAGQIRELLNQAIDVLVVVPNDADRLTEVIGEAKAKGIPVISYDRLVRNAAVDLYISFDNEKVGSLMAEALVKAVPTGNYVVLNGPRSDNNAKMINVGLHKVLDPRIENHHISIVSELWPASWDSDQVYELLEPVIERNRRIDAVLAGNDTLAEAVIKVLSENRLVAKVKVTGQDADLAACQRIAEGTQYLTIYKPIDRLALKAAAFAVMLAKGERIQTDSTIDDGSHQVPYVRLEPILVTQDLLESTVIRDGFHASSEIYRNVKAP